MHEKIYENSIDSRGSHGGNRGDLSQRSRCFVNEFSNLVGYGEGGTI